MKRLKLTELRERARILTYETLNDYEIPDDIEAKITLGIGFDGEDRIFELYIPGERPEDAIVISSARLNSFTGEGTVEVFLRKKTSLRSELERRRETLWFGEAVDPFS